MHRRLLSVVLAALALAALGASSASAAPTWAPAASATIHPGVQVFTDGAQCTANFVFFDAANVYLGQAAHCSGTGSATDTDGCTSASLPIGTPVDITGASKPGTLVYNSWLTMQSLGEADPDTCAFNDLALVRIDPADVGRSTLRSLSGAGRRASTGRHVARGQGAELRTPSCAAASRRSGRRRGEPGRRRGGWSHTVYTVTPGIPGDSGSAFLNRPARRSASCRPWRSRRVAGATRGDIATTRLPRRQHELRRHARERHRAFPGTAAAV